MFGYIFLRLVSIG